MGPRGRSLRRPLLTGLTVAGIFLAGLAPAASAHVQLVGSDPPDATSLSSVPREIHLRFNEVLSDRFRQVRLLDAHGRPVSGTSTTPGDGGRSLTLTLPPALPRGAYEVTWEALSASDGHVSGGALVLGLGAVVGPPVVGAPAAGVKTFDAILRWLFLSVLLWLIGAIGMSVVLLRARFAGPEGAGSRDRALRRVLGSIGPMAAIGAAVGVALLVREAATLPGGSGLVATVGQLIGERWGVEWAVSELALLALAVCGLHLRRTASPERSRAALGIAGLLVLTLVVVHALSGHAASVPDPVVHVIAATGHLLGAGLWLGCVAVLAMLVWPRRRGRPSDAATLVRAVRRPFSWLVGGALLLAVLTGLVTLGVQVRSVDALLTTDYGSSLLAKTALMAAAALFGLANAVLLLRLGRRRGDAPTVRMSRLMAIEVALGVGALLAAAELTASAPPRGPEFAAPRPVRALVLARQVEDVLVGATARPNRVGANVFTVTTASTRRVYGKPVTAVSLSLRPQVAGGSPLTLPLTALGQDKWTGGTRLGSAGAWQMAVIIRRPGGERLVAPLTWRVEPADRVLPVRHSARRLAPIADLVALVLLGGTVVLLAALLSGLWLRGRGGTGTIGRSSSSVSKDAI